MTFVIESPKCFFPQCTEGITGRNTGASVILSHHETIPIRVALTTASCRELTRSFL